MTELAAIAWFANVPMLLWVSAAAVPVLIHLWTRRRYQETSWAAMRFLLLAIRKSQRRLRIEQLVLLAVRMLILLLLAAALAEPFLAGHAAVNFVPPPPPIHTVLVLDASFSMGYRRQGMTRFERAQQLATEAVRAAKLGDAFSLIWMAGDADAVIREPSMNHSAVLDEISDLQLSNTIAGLEAALGESERLLAQAAARFERQHVQIYTDFGSNTWNSGDVDRLHARLDRLASDVELRLIDLGQEEPSNVAITRLNSPQRMISPQQVTRFEVELMNVGRQQLSRKRVELFVDDRPVGEKYVDLPAGAPTTAVFSHQFATPGDHVVRASLGPDALNADNERWLAVTVHAALRVLCVEGSQHAADYIAVAMRPNPQTDSLLAPSVISTHEFAGADLSDVSCVILCNVDRISPQEARFLHDYVSGGGGLVIVLGDQVDAANYNDLLGEASASRVLPVEIGALSRTAIRRLDPLQYRHELIAPFRGHEGAGLLTAPIWKYFRLGRPAREKEIALAFDNGDPAIVASQVGWGRTVVLATAASPDSVDRSTNPPTPWNALSAWPSFPPLVHELVYYAAGDQQRRRNVLVGDPLSLRLTGVVSDIVITKPDKTTIGGVADGEQDTSILFDETDLPGVYAVAYEGGVVEQFTANLDASESRLSRTDPGLSQDGSESAASAVGAERLAAGADVPLYRFLLAAVGVLLLLDTLLAWRFRVQTR